MKYLNLTTGFSPVNSESDNVIQYEYATFSGGEPHIKLQDKISYFSHVTISIKLESFNDVGKLLVAVDALKRNVISYSGHQRIHLFLPYFPGARQDRIMVKGEAFTAKVYADLINSMGFKTVTIVDPHSDVTPALINNCIVIDNHKFVLEVLRDLFPQSKVTTPLLVSPDAGANKKVLKLAQYLSEFNTMKIVKCDKTRNVQTGNITGFEVYKENLNGQDCVIVDDICDGGRTFIGLADELKTKNAGKLYLIVTHGIFSHGVGELLKYYEKIYTTDSFGDPIDGVETIELQTILNVK